MKAHMTSATNMPGPSQPTCNFDRIEEPGVYVENRWGTIFRMPEDALPANPQRAARRVARERWPVTRVSRNPRISLELARKLAANLGVATSF